MHLKFMSIFLLLSSINCFSMQPASVFKPRTIPGGSIGMNCVGCVDKLFALFYERSNLMPPFWPQNKVDQFRLMRLVEPILPHLAHVNPHEFQRILNQRLNDLLGNMIPPIRAEFLARWTTLEYAIGEAQNARARYAPASKF